MRTIQAMWPTLIFVSSWTTCPKPSASGHQTRMAKLPNCLHSTRFFGLFWVRTETAGLLYKLGPRLS